MATDNGGMEVLRTNVEKFHPDAADPFAPYRSGNGETHTRGAGSPFTETKKLGLPGLELYEPSTIQPVGPTVPDWEERLQAGDEKVAGSELTKSSTKEDGKNVSKEGGVGSGSADPNVESEK